jgi:hypothetical protein
MKRTKHIFADDGSRKIEIIIRQEMDANYESEIIKSKLEDFEDDIFKLLLERYHHSDIRIIKRT